MMDRLACLSFISLNRSKSVRLARSDFLAMFLAQLVSAHLASMPAASHAS